MTENLHFVQWREDTESGIDGAVPGTFWTPKSQRNSKPQASFSHGFFDEDWPPSCQLSPPPKPSKRHSFAPSTEDWIPPPSCYEVNKEEVHDPVVGSSACSTPVTDILACHTYLEDDMASWLHYPLDNSLDKNCGELFSDNSHLQVFKDASLSHTMVGHEQRSLPSLGSNAMVANGLEMQDCGNANAIYKWQNNPLGLVGKCQDINASTTLSPKTQTPSAHKSGPLNFSHFSRPAVRARANRHTLGGSTANSQVNDANTRSSMPTLGVSTAISQVKDDNTRGSIQHNIPESSQNESTLEPSSTNASLQTEGWMLPRKDQASDVTTLKLPKPPSKIIGKGSQRSCGFTDAVEQSITSSSGDSGAISREKAKRKSKDIEEYGECQSEEAEVELSDFKKPSGGRAGGTTKRSRAAEVHNLSERRRRDRINEKMKALQELIPNANKTDKASVLDEAIEYLKMLQVQIQMMSMRCAMPFPSMIMPTQMQPGIQHMQMPNMPSFSPMDMNMGMGLQMGSGIGVIDSSGRSVVAMPGSSTTIPSSGPLVPATDRFIPPHQLQMHVQPVNTDVYHAYLLQQLHQQQQVLQQQSQQQQQFQLQKVQNRKTKEK